MATTTWTGAKTTKWALAENWSGGRIPLAEDEVLMEGSVPCEVGAAAQKCRSIKKGAGAYTGKLIQAGGSLAIGDGTAGTGGVAVDLTGIAYESTGGGAWKLISTSATQQTVKWAGAVVRAVTVEGTGSSYLLEDEIKQKEASDIFTVAKGVFASNAKTMDIGVMEASGTQARTLNIEGSVVKVKGISGTLWNFTNVTNLTFAAAGSTIELTKPGVALAVEAVPVFMGAGKTFGALKVLGGAIEASIAVEITGGATFAGILTNNTSSKPSSLEGSISGTTLTVTSGAGNLRKGSGLAGGEVKVGTQVIKEITASTFEVSPSQTAAATTMEVFAPGLLIAASTTVTVEGFEANGKSGARARLASGTPGTQATLKKSVAEQVSIDWMRIVDSKVDASPKWYGGANSVYANQTNWLEEAPPATGAAVAMLL